MDYANAAVLLGIGFVVGISGAIMPGPLLIYTIQESLKKGKWVGALVILGHAIVEVFIFLLLALGLLSFVSTPDYTKAASIIGGAALIYMAFDSVKDLNSRVEIKLKKRSYGLVMGGVIFTAFNPGFPVWWLTAGTRLLMEGYAQMGVSGMLIVLIGHWGADLGWFLFVSFTASRGSRFLFEKGWYKGVRIALAALLMVIGAYFLWTGVR
ncbi:MAG: LysE family transporter [Candidatus Altiarchaeia archaeon]|jgi:threonine/homoserine/homoserine lactone efflux protein